MHDETRVSIDIHLREDQKLATMPLEVRAGLHMRPRSVPSKYFYDDVGSHLFEEITQLPEYYPTRTEEDVLDTHAAEIAERVDGHELLELGSGSARKTHRLIDAMLAQGKLERFLPFDVSASAAELSVRRIADDYPALEIRGIVGDYERHLGRVPRGHARLVAFLGGTIGNFHPERAIGFLQQVHGLVEDAGWLLLGTDLVKDRRVLEAAYNDSAGVTAKFNKNILRVMNRRLQADFDPDRFDHVAFYNRKHSRIEMHLRAIVQHDVHVRALDERFRFAEHEMIRTELSRKFTRSSAERLLNASGFALERWFTDADEKFALSLARPVRNGC